MKQSSHFFGFLLVATLAAGCATPTPYKKFNGKYPEGYVDGEVHGVKHVKFGGNSHTSKNYARERAMFRAIQFCRENGFKLARFWNSTDQSTSGTVQKSYTSNYVAPTYVSGNINSDTSYGYKSANTVGSYNANVSGGSTTSNTQTWNETTTFPLIDVEFECMNEVYLTGIQGEDIPTEKLNQYVHDFLGGILISEITGDSPNRSILAKGNVLISVNKERVESIRGLQKLLINAEDKSKIPAVILVEGKKKNVFLKALDDKGQFERLNNEFLNNVCAALDLAKESICINRLKRS